ncbi:MAG: hypothetical protein AAF389_13180 [Gemmatimonadota bacterium]
MAIDPTRPSDLRTGQAGHADRAELGEREGSGAPVRPPVRGDQVEISDQARALVEQGGVDDTPTTQTRLAEVQGRLDSGFYEQPETIRQTASKILESGDL